MSKKVLIIGDGVALHTGFAQVIRPCVAEFHRRGWEIHQIACQDMPPWCDSREYHRQHVTPYFPSNPDVLGINIAREIIDHVEPDILFFNADPGTVDNWTRVLSAIGYADLPTVAYMPVEGAPISPSLARPFAAITEAFTYTKWSSDRLKMEYDMTIPWVYHGVDTKIYHPLTPDERRDVREKLGWVDKFVVMYVAKNAQRKAHDRLVKAFNYLKGQGHTDVHLYLHTKREDKHWLYGWDLEWLAWVCGVSDMVEFPDQHRSATGESTVSLVQKYGAADLYVSPAKVEGFGLPLLEAMACGLPVVCAHDQGNQSEIVGTAALAQIEPIDLETWFTGVQMVNIDPSVIGQVIEAVKGRPDRLSAAIERGLTHVKQFSWEKMATTLADALDRVHRTAPAFPYASRQKEAVQAELV